ncbi:tannase and feruloyl esterase [Cryphonectria parasitica EP155]|uniref:Carboxylic ester hydrolase n=1 Tax=Cryphonectria parasitica (strain ATCC 38755 / EP155) TaxID=660469 RepID=A0A9P5CK86_CRYP1|nr:tannase and feruloyl esterase [Cryphonectria parasitica EP155]KAF3762019.1 tannase and feruloyl esterase [Cryphonectria parasitica EP155]
MRADTHLAAAAVVAAANAATLGDVCTTSYVESVLPADGTFLGISLDSTSVNTTAHYNVSISSSTFYPAATIDYCVVTFNYTHTARDDTVAVTYWMPGPANFKNRFLTTGGEAYEINEGSSTTGSLPGGVMYGAASGLTDGGFNGEAFDDVFLDANGTVNWQNTYMFGYQGIHEMMTIGREFSKNFYNTTDKIYTYYQSCSEGGREGWSQAQRFGADYDGIIVGAPAFRFAQQQINHLTSNVVEKTLGYYPPPCELELIVNATIRACDALDGKSDGVIARSDLCKLNFNISSLVGAAYYCTASSGSSSIGLGFGKRQTSTTPAQNGTVTELGVQVAQTILDGLKDTKGRQAYLSYQPGADFDDAATTYDSTTGTWGLSIDGNGGEFVAKFVQLLDISSIESLDNVTYDTVRDWMQYAWTKYQDTLQVNNPDLTDIALSGGKIIHFHGESDPSVPTASSVHYRESVRKIMFPGMSLNESSEALNAFYRLYLVPGAAHCATNSEQPNGPFPQTNLAVMIDWVENGVEPVLLNATVLSGDNEGQTGKLCSWPLRPLWTNNGTTMDCVFDQASYDTWIYDFDAYPLPLY